MHGGKTQQSVIERVTKILAGTYCSEDALLVALNFQTLFCLSTIEMGTSKGC